MAQLYEGELAQLYDLAVPNWPDEIGCYHQLARSAAIDQPTVLELACGTGRVALQLADSGCLVAGIDLSREMLDIARAKSTGDAPVEWIHGDIRSFNLNRSFDAAIIPAYSFQLLLTDEDQLACLRQCANHLRTGAKLVLHLETFDPEWLASLPVGDFTDFEPSGVVTHPESGQRIRVSYAWSRDVDRPVASVIARYETLNSSARVLADRNRPPIHVFLTSPADLQRQLETTGFRTLSVLGDFSGRAFDNDADEMIWIAERT